VSDAAVVVGGGIVRIELDRFVVLANGKVEFVLLAMRGAAVVGGDGVSARRRARWSRRWSGRWGCAAQCRDRELRLGPVLADAAAVHIGLEPGEVTEGFAIRAFLLRDLGEPRLRALTIGAAPAGCQIGVDLG